MAGRQNLSNTAAEDTVFANLGLTREDLGMDTDDGSGNEDLETRELETKSRNVWLRMIDQAAEQQQQPRVSQTEESVCLRRLRSILITKGILSTSMVRSLLGQVRKLVSIKTCIRP